MPLPRDRYPDPDNTLASYALLKLERQRVAEAIAERDEGIRESNETLDLANEMIDERNKALNERDKELARRELWMGIAHKNFHNAGKEYRRAKDAERERDELQQQNDKLDAFLKADILDTRDKRIEELERAERQNIKLERELVKAQMEVDRWKESELYVSKELGKRELEVADLIKERDKLAAALKKIKTLPFNITERIIEIIDAALDGEE